jgi:hypothetical protein
MGGSGFRFVGHAFRSSFTNKSGIFRRYPDLNSGSRAGIGSDARSVPRHFPYVNQASGSGDAPSAVLS